MHSRDLNYEILKLQHVRNAKSDKHNIHIEVK